MKCRIRYCWGFRAIRPIFGHPLETTMDQVFTSSPRRNCARPTAAGAFVQNTGAGQRGGAWSAGVSELKGAPFGGGRGRGASTRSGGPAGRSRARSEPARGWAGDKNR